METEKIDENNIILTNIESDKKPSAMVIIAAILLILAGVISIISWVSILSLDIATIEKFIDISQFQQFNPSITIEEIKGFLTTCSTVGIIIAIFPILGGILSLKKKSWTIAITGSLIGLLTFIPSIFGGVLSFIGLILLILSRKEFQK